MKRYGLLLLAAAACFRDPITAPADTTLTLAATSSTVPLNGLVDVVVEVLDPTGKTVKDGTPITLTCCTADGALMGSQAAVSAAAAGDSIVTSVLGTMQPALVHTVNGKATARFRAGRRSGTAHIIARSGGARPGTLELAIGGAAVERITLSASPAIVSSSPADIALHATALDAYGNGIGGVAIALSTSAGVLASGNLVTDGDGRASTHVTTNRETVVTAVAGAHSTSTTIQLSPPPSLAMSAVPRSPMSGEVVQFSVIASASGNGPQLRDLVMEFGDGTRTTISGLAGTTNIAHTYANPGLYHVTSTVTDILGERTASTMIIAVVARPLVSVVLEVSGGQALTIDVPAVFSAVISPAGEQFRVLRFEWDFGDESAATTTGNACAHVFTSLGVKTISVTAVLSDGTHASASTVVVVKSPP